MTSSGETMPAMILRHAEFEQALFERPDDDLAWAVYGDWLATQGDPRGELIQLELALEAGPTSTELRSRYAKLMVHEHPRWVGEPLSTLLAEYGASRDFAVEWRRGHLLHARILAHGSQGAAPRLDALLRSPTAMMLEHILVEIDADRDDLQALDPAVWQHAELHALRQLTLKAWTFRRGKGPPLIDLAFDWMRVWPRLETLRLHALHWQLSPPIHPRLRTLEFSTRHGAELEPLRMLGQAELPKLEQLALFIGTVLPEHAEPFAEVLDDVLAMAGRSGVIRLALVAVDQPESLLAKLARQSELLDQIEGLHLRWGLLGDEHAAALAELLVRCPRLWKVDLGGNYIGEAGRAALRAALAGKMRIEGLVNQKDDYGRANRQIPVFGRYGIAEDQYEDWDAED